MPVQTISCSLSPVKLQELVEKEFEMALQDRMMEETKEKKNAVEAYVLDMRAKLEMGHGPFVAATTRDTFMQKLQQTEDWLYDDGEDETKGVYVAKLEELHAVGDPIEERFKESTLRGPAASALRKAAEGFVAQANDPARAHIEAAQLDSVRKEAEAALSWLGEKEAAQARAHAQRTRRTPLSLPGPLTLRRRHCICGARHSARCKAACCGACADRSRPCPSTMSACPQSRLAQVDPPAFLSRDASKKLETLNRFCGAESPRALRCAALRRQSHARPGLVAVRARTWRAALPYPAA